MTELIVVKDREALTTTLAIADGTENPHPSVIKLVRKYREDLSEFGEVGFEIRLNTQGSPTEYGLLNEPQATLLMTYMRNTDIVRQFKKRLVKAFYEMREQLLMEGGERRKVDVNFNHIRGITNPHGLDVKYTLDLTKIVMSPTRRNLSVLERLTGIPLADILPEASETAAGPDYVARFVEECCQPIDPTRRIPFKRLYDHFRRWYALEIDAGHFGLPSKREVGKRLRALGYDMPDPRTTSGQAFVCGLELAGQGEASLAS